MKSLVTGKKGNKGLIFKKGRKDDLVTGKIMVQILLEVMLRHMKEREVIWDN